VPTIIEYKIVLERLQQHGLKCLYFNSGAFGFAADVFSQSLGWIGPPDSSIQPAARALVRSVSAPFEKNLADLAERAWRELLPGRVWVMPKSHWAYELDFANRQWLRPLLTEISIDARELERRNNAAAIELVDAERGLFHLLVQRLLENLVTSDFLMAFPEHRTVCTIHSHKQLWWTTGDLLIAKGLETFVPV
jgi:hypothetical protein